jgi:hypothetical protein
MDLRWFGDDANRIPALAQELVGLQPDIILTGATPARLANYRDRSMAGRARRAQESDESDSFPRYSSLKRSKVNHRLYCIGRGRERPAIEAPESGGSCFPGQLSTFGNRNTMLLVTMCSLFRRVFARLFGGRRL